jgi:hypothetical protein
MLDEVIVGLGYSLDSYNGDPSEDKDQGPVFNAGLLDKIEKGEMTVEDAIALINKGK